MRLKLTLQRDDGTRDDLVVTTDASASIEDVARAIAERDPRGVDPGPSIRLTLRRLVPGGPGAPDAWSPLPPTARVGEHWLASGATVALADGEPPAPAGPVATLEILSGPQRGERWPLPAGTSVIGRDAACDVVLDDRYVSARHARIEVADVVDLVDAGSANGIELDGELVGRVSIRESEVVTIGSTALRITLPGAARSALPVEPPRRAGGPVAFHRSPRVEPRYAGERFAVPAVPVEREPSPLPWLAMIAPVLLGLAMAALLGRASMLLLVLLSPVMLLGGFLVTRTRDRRGLARSIARFEERLGALAADAQTAFAEERATRLAEAPSTAEAVDAAIALRPLLWTRRPEHWTFLNVRLGTGDMPTRCEFLVPARGEMIPELQERLDALLARHRTVPDAPIVDNLYEAGAIGCAGSDELVAPVLNGIVAQLAGLHSPAELAVAAIVTPWWSGELGWLKWLPHSSSPQSPLGTGPHLADSSSSAAALLSAIEGLVAARSAGAEPIRRGAVARSSAALARGAEVEEGGEDVGTGTPAPVPSLLVVVAHDAPVDRARLVRLAELGPDAGVFLVWVAPRVAALPAACRAVVEVTAPGFGAVSLVRLGERIEPAGLETLDRERALAFSRALAPVLDSGAIVADASDTPRFVALAELLGHERFESPEAVIGRWRENDSILDRTRRAAPARGRTGRLRALVGLAAGDAMHLDLRAHGPHALVGGTTGAGKSEFLQTWVLGMAAEVSPDRVNFLFVDYKGGSAFADCVRLPHCVGLVTDLTPALVRRALTSLHAELHHRERLLARTRAKDILDLERRADPDAPPALVIVVDEFAALATEAPDFVDGVVDIAQRGRSLGIHLILATQRPAGVIKDGLRANTNLRVALRMADEPDSQDVVGVPDAARFEPGDPGRAIARTGPGRLEAFQSAYSGGWTARSAPTAEVSVTELRFGNELEWPPRHRGEDPAPAEELGPNDQQRLVEAISGAAERARIPEPRRPWLDELPAIVGLAALRTEDDAEIAFALADDPASQRQSPVAFRPDVDGHLAIYGTGGSGKSVVLRSIAVATAATPRGGPVHVYALDFAAGGLRMLEGLPHVGAVIPGEDAERVQRLLRRLRAELEQRSRRYPAVAAASVAEYRRLAGAPGEPRILLLVDGFPAFRDEWELVAGRSASYDAFRAVLAGGRQLGIHVAFTADSPASVPNAVSAVVQRRLVLRLSDDGAYARFGLPRDLLAETSPPGRAIVDGLEAQVAVFGAGESVSSAADQAGALAAFVERHAARIPVAEAVASLPAEIDADAVPPSRHGRPVLGVSDETLEPAVFEPVGALLLSGPPQSGRSIALAWIVRALRSLDAPPSLVYLGHGRSPLVRDPAFDHRATTVEAVAELAGTLAREPAAGGSGRCAVVIESIAEFLQTPADAPLVELIRRARRHEHLVVAEHDVAGWNGSWPLLAEVKSARRGLLLQPDPAEGDILLKTSLPRAPRAEFPPGRGLFVERGRAVRIQVPHLRTEA